MTSKMEDDLKNGRRPRKWKTTSKTENYLKNVTRTSKTSPTPEKFDQHFKKRTTTSKNGRRPQKTDDDLERRTTISKNGRRPQKTADDLKNGTLPTVNRVPTKCSPKSHAKSSASPTQNYAKRVGPRLVIGLPQQAKS